MRVGRRTITAATAALFVAAGLSVIRAQETPEEAPPRTYGKTPEELLPYRAAGKPYRRFFTEPPAFRGPGRETVEPEGVTEVPIGVLVPMEGEDEPLGRRMQRGVTLAVEEGNAAGGFRPGVPFTMAVRDEAQAWGAAGNAAVELTYDQGVWGLVGALEDANSHVLSRVLLKIEVPVVNTGGPDPTLTEHNIPWMVRTRPDDRRNCYRLARKVFQEDGHSRVAVFRANNRYARMGIKEFVDAARRLHHPVLLEVRFEPRETEWEARIERIRAVQPDAIVLWGKAETAGRALRALRAAGLEQPVYGPDRLMDPRFLEAAGKSAEGVVFTYPFDPTTQRAAWTGFAKRYRGRFGEEPDAVAASAYDGTRYLLDAIREGGLNRARIRDALFGHATYEGATGTIRFDPTHNNVAEVVLGRVENGEFRFPGDDG